MATLLGEWGFLDNLADTSGNGHTGTATGSVSYIAGPQSGTKAIQFGSSTDFVDFGRTGLEPTADGLVIMGWIKSNTTGSNWLGLLTKARAAGSTRHRIGTSQTRNPAYAARWKDDLHTNDAITPALDTGWHHVAMVDGNTKWALYVDGVVVSGHNGTRALTNGTSPVWEAFNWITGRNNTLGDQNADATMAVSGIRIFQGEMTATEITTWMNTPVTGVTAPPAGAGWEARSSTGLRYRPHVLLGGSPVEMSWTPMPKRGYTTFRFDKTGDFATGAKLPTATPGTLIPNWTNQPFSTSQLEVRTRYALKQHFEVQWTDTATRGYYCVLFNGTTSLQGVNPINNTVNLGGGIWGLNVDSYQATDILDPAVPIPLTFREWAASSGVDNVFKDACWIELIPLVLDATIATDLVIPKPGTAAVVALASWNTTDASGYFYSDASKMFNGPSFNTGGTSRPGGTLSGQISVVTDVSGSYTLSVTTSPNNGSLSSVGPVALTAGVPYAWDYSFLANNTTINLANEMWPRFTISGSSVVGANITFKAGSTLKYTP